MTEEETTSVTPDSADATAMQALIGLQNSGAKIVNRLALIVFKHMLINVHYSL